MAQVRRFFLSSMAGFALLLCPALQFPSFGDWLILHDGTEIPCLIRLNEEDQEFKPVLEDELEVEIGFWVLKVKKSIIRDYIIDPDSYVPPSPEEVTTWVNQILQPGTGRPDDAGSSGYARGTLLAKITYLSNFAWIGKGDEESRAALEETLQSGQYLRVARNSRARLTLPPRMQIGTDSRSRVDIDTMYREVEGSVVTWNVDLRVPYGSLWIRVERMEARESVQLRVNNWSLVIKEEALLEIRTDDGSQFVLSYWRGPRVLETWLPTRGGYMLALGNEIRFNAGDAQGEVLEYELTGGGDQRWDQWQRFEPQKFDLKLRRVHPPLDRIGSFGIEYALRNPVGWRALDPRKRVSGNILTDLDYYRGAVEAFRKDVGRLPRDNEGLIILIEGKGISGWKGPYLLEDEVRPDPWHEPYRYIVLGTERFLVYSSGPNRVDDFGLGDDIH